MTRSLAGLVVAASLAIAVTAAACGDSPKQATAPASHAPGGAGNLSAPTPAGAQPGIPSSPCLLLNPSQVQVLLGAPAVQQGSLTVYAPNYKTCGWATGGAGNVNGLRLAVILRSNPADKGFDPPGNLGPATSIAGLGDNATFATKGGTGNQFGESILVANKRLASVSIDMNYGGSVPHPGSTEAAMADDIREIFTRLGQ